VGRSKLGDYLLTYGEGESYFKRLIYVNILLYVVMAIAFIVYMVDIVILALIAIVTVVVSLAYALFFLKRNPPSEVSEELLDTY
jgi:hypothetical protein